jgi:hypothetical protein
MPLEADRVYSVRKRLQQVYEYSGSSCLGLRPVVLSLQQLCRLAEREEFDQNWWSTVTNYPTSGPEDRLVFFCSQIGSDAFALTKQTACEWAMDWIVCLG